MYYVRACPELSKYGTAKPNGFVWDIERERVRDDRVVGRGTTGTTSGGWGVHRCPQVLWSIAESADKPKCPSPLT